MAISLDPNDKLLATAGESLADPSFHRQLVGKLLYLTVTRTDVAFAAYVLSQFVHVPTTVHLAVLFRVLRYIKGLSRARPFSFQIESSLLIVIVIGLVIPMTGGLLVDIVYFWVILCYPGSPRSNLSLPDLHLRQSIEP